MGFLNVFGYKRPEKSFMARPSKWSPKTTHGTIGQSTLMAMPGGADLTMSGSSMFNGPSDLTENLAKYMKMFDSQAKVEPKSPVKVQHARPILPHESGIFLGSSDFSDDSLDLMPRIVSPKTLATDASDDVFGLNNHTDQTTDQVSPRVMLKPKSQIKRRGRLVSDISEIVIDAADLTDGTIDDADLDDRASSPTTSELHNLDGLSNFVQKVPDYLQDSATWSPPGSAEPDLPEPWSHREPSRTASEQSTASTTIRYPLAKTKNLVEQISSGADASAGDMVGPNKQGPREHDASCNICVTKRHSAPTALSPFDYELDTKTSASFDASPSVLTVKKRQSATKSASPAEPLPRQHLGSPAPSVSPIKARTRTPLVAESLSILDDRPFRLKDPSNLTENIIEYVERPKAPTPPMTKWMSVAEFAEALAAAEKDKADMEARALMAEAAEAASMEAAENDRQEMESWAIQMKATAVAAVQDAEKDKTDLEARAVKAETAAAAAMEAAHNDRQETEALAIKMETAAVRFVEAAEKDKADMEVRAIRAEAAAAAANEVANEQKQTAEALAVKMDAAALTAIKGAEQEMKRMEVRAVKAEAALAKATKASKKERQTIEALAIKMDAAAVTALKGAEKEVKRMEARATKAESAAAKVTEAAKKETSEMELWLLEMEAAAAAAVGAAEREMKGTRAAASRTRQVEEDAAYEMKQMRAWARDVQETAASAIAAAEEEKSEMKDWAMQVEADAEKKMAEREQEWRQNAEALMTQLDSRNQACFQLWGQLEHPGETDADGNQKYTYRCVDKNTGAPLA